MTDHDAQDLLRELIRFIGDDPDRPGLVETPRRIIKAWAEIFAGYHMPPPALTDFDDPHDELVIVRNVAFVSTCEHHLLPFHGTAAVAYLPNGRILGLSKLIRVIEWHARRLQVQERLTREIAGTITKALNPRGVGVVIRATHLCMVARGIKQAHAEAVTSVVDGELRVEGPARQEFLTLLREA